MPKDLIMEKNNMSGPAFIYNWMGDIVQRIFIIYVNFCI